MGITTKSLSLTPLLLLAGMSWASAADPVTVTVAEGGPVDSLDPTLYTTTAPLNLAMNIADPLVAIQDGKVVGVLAESWDIPSPDRYVLHLRHGVKFQDGTPFTAADVKFTLDRILDPDTHSGLLPYIALIKNIEVIDDYTVGIDLSAPQVTFLSNLTRGIVMISKAAFEAEGAEGFGEHPVTTGPYRVASWDHASEWVLEANPDYWQGRPAIDRVIFRVIPEISTQVAGLLSGELDITSAIGYDTADLIAHSDGVRVETASGLYQEMIVLNTNHPPFDDVRVRQALNYAVDMDSILAGIYQGRGQHTSQPFTSAVFGYDSSIQPYPYDPDKARQLLAEAGYPDGFDAELIFPAGGGATGAMGRLAEAVAANLADIGVHVSISSPDRIEHSRQVYSEGTMKDMAVAQHVNRVGDADFTIALYFDPNRRAFFFNTPELADLAERQLQAADPDERLSILHEMGQYLHDQAPWVYVAEVPLLYGVSDRLEWRARPDQVIQLYGAHLK